MRGCLGAWFHTGLALWAPALEGEPHPREPHPLGQPEHHPALPHFAPSRPRPGVRGGVPTPAPWRMATHRATPPPRVTGEASGRGSHWLPDTSTPACADVIILPLFCFPFMLNFNETIQFILWWPSTKAQPMITYGKEWRSTLCMWSQSGLWGHAELRLLWRQLHVNQPIPSPKPLKMGGDLNPPVLNPKLWSCAHPLSLRIFHRNKAAQSSVSVIDGGEERVGVRLDNSYMQCLENCRAETEVRDYRAAKCSAKITAG